MDMLDYAFLFLAFIACLFIMAAAFIKWVGYMFEQGENHKK